MEQLNKRMEVRNLSKTFFGKKGYFTAIEDVSLDVYDGEFLVILGPGRCGKTVLLNIMSGLEAVSYTHLDVYKRQVQTFPDFTGFTAVFLYNPLIMFK